nr:molybdopterin-guanine dinucleotide biosynthesis protein MobB [uncultured Sharpea sp.]
MIKVDLITGFLGSGKTTFIKKYVEYLASQHLRVAVIENDYGAINVDRMLLSDVSRQSLFLWACRAMIV